MKTFEHKDRAKPTPTGPLPESISRWAERKTLADLVLETVRGVDVASIHPVSAPGTGVAFRPQVLLAVVTYCYAVGTLGSQDVEALMREDHAFRFLCQNEFPDWRTIRQFRRRNREVVCRSLAATFREAWSLKAQGRGIEPAAVIPGAIGTATNRGPAPSPEQILDEAEARIDRAMFIDSMTDDE